MTGLEPVFTLENTMRETLIVRLCVMTMLLGLAHDVLAQQNPIRSASPGQPASQNSQASNQKGQAAASIGNTVDNISTFGVAPLDTLNQWAAYSNGSSGGQMFGNLGNVMDLGAAALKITSAQQQGNYDAAAGEAEQYVVTTGVKSFVVDVGGGAGGPVGEMVAGAAFSLGQMIQKLPCNGGTVQDCVTDLEFGVYDAFRDHGGGGTNVGPPSRDTTDGGTSVGPLSFDLSNKIGEYFSSDPADGLEPGSTDQHLVAPPGSQPPSAAEALADSATTITAESAQEYANAPGPPPPGPNSERDTDYSSTTVAPVSMNPSDPNSCTKTSDSMGIGSVSINCTPNGQTASQTSLSQNISDLESQLGVQAPPDASGANAQAPPAQANARNGQAATGSPGGSRTNSFAQPQAPIGTLLQPASSENGCSAFNQALANLARRYAPIAGTNSCQAHRAALRLDQLTLQTVDQYARTCAAAAGAVSSTEATIRTESQLVNQACSH